MRDLEIRLTNIGIMANNLKSSTLALSEAVKYGDNTVDKYCGAVDMLYEGLSILVDMCNNAQNITE